MRRFVIVVLAVVAVCVGAFFGAADFDIPYEELVEKYGQEPSSFIELPSGLTAHFRDEGNPDGRVIVLLHGSNSSLFTWDPWVRELGSDYRIVRVDMLGHGLSSLAPGHDYSHAAQESFLEEFVSALDLTTFVLAGNSMGGGIAWRYGLAHGDQVEALVLLDASGIPQGEESEPPAVYKIARMPVLNKALLYILPKKMVADGLRDAIVNDDLVTAEMVGWYHDLLLREGRREASRARLLAGFEPSPVERLSELQMPTLILWGEEDSWVPVEAAYVFDEEIPNSTLITYADVGHLPMEEIPSQSAEDLRTFLTLN